MAGLHIDFSFKIPQKTIVFSSVLPTVNRQLVACDQSREMQSVRRQHVRLGFPAGCWAKNNNQHGPDGAEQRRPWPRPRVVAVLGVLFDQKLQAANRQKVAVATEFH